MAPLRTPVGLRGSHLWLRGRAPGARLGDLKVFISAAAAARAAGILDWATRAPAATILPAEQNLFVDDLPKTGLGRRACSGTGGVRRAASARSAVGNLTPLDATERRRLRGEPSNTVKSYVRQAP